MKRATTLSWLVDRQNRDWLSWWQELILNWIASWHNIGTVIVIDVDGDRQCEWSLPSDLELKRQELEELL